MSGHILMHFFATQSLVKSNDTYYREAIQKKIGTNQAAETGSPVHDTMLLNCSIFVSVFSFVFVFLLSHAMHHNATQLLQH